MFQFKSLEGVSLDVLLGIFNQAFSKYIIPMNLEKSIFEWKLKSENFNPSLSVGAFIKDQLIGFILHCIDDKYAPNTVYNGGTGVIENYRGNDLTCRMYEYIIPILKANSIKYALLEVIDGNHPANHNYVKIGFETTRIFNSYKGLGQINASTNPIFTVEKGKIEDFIQCTPFDSSTPSWQNNDGLVIRAQDTMEIIVAKYKNEFIGYACYNPMIKRIHQLAVAPQFRQKGVATALIQYILKHYDAEFSCINVDETDIPFNNLLHSIGLNASIKCIEMKKSI